MRKNKAGNAIRYSAAYKVGQSINYSLLTLLGVVTLYPFWYCLILSFNNGKDALKGDIFFWPRVFTLDNYAEAFKHPLIGSSFVISISRTVLVVVVGVFLVSLMAYALAQKSLPGRSGITFYFYFTQIFGAGLIPTFILYRQLGLLNNYWILVLPFLYSFMHTVIVRTYFNTIPPSLPESARIDGASEFRIFFRIMLPLSVPTLAAIALFTGVGIWNDWFTGAYFLMRRQNLFPAATLLRQLLMDIPAVPDPDTIQDLQWVANTNSTPESMRLTFLIILTFPIICIYPFLQKYFIKGVMLGSVKE